MIFYIRINEYKEEKMFNFSFDNRTIWIIVGIVLLIGITSFANNQNGILDLLFTLPGVLIAITFHEFAHAFVADKLGDTTPREQGRLNLNPFSHVDPIGFVFLLVAGFGWGKPVEINSRNFNRDMPLSKAEAIVAAAGPITNLILAFILIVISYAITLIPGFKGQTAVIIETIISYAAVINIGLGIFNLIPLPPLDGSKILAHFLPYNAKTWFYENERIFYIAFIMLWVTKLSSIILSPIFNWIYSGMNFIVASIFSLF